MLLFVAIAGLGVFIIMMKKTKGKVIYFVTLQYLYICTSRYPVGISTEFCFRWQKNLQGGKGKAIRGGGEGMKIIIIIIKLVH